jgi:hypothetical protein
MVEAAEAAVNREGSRHGQDRQEAEAEQEVEGQVLRFCIALIDHALGD